MRTSRLLRAMMLSLFLLLSVVLVASAAPDRVVSRHAVRLRNATIPWNFPPPTGLSGDFCGEIPEGVSINPDDFGSNRRKHATVFERPDGTKRILIRDVVTGTASDNFGTSYTFTYRNNLTARFDGSFVHVKWTDYVRMRGGDVDYTVRFVWLWSYEAADLNLVEFQDGNGEIVNLGIDPFIIPTNDGVTESPDIVPGSWRRMRTQGDPWNCDPL